MTTKVYDFRREQYFDANSFLTTQRTQEIFRIFV
jgi:hypothetical protein